MRQTIPLAIVGIIALAGCASAGGPADTSAPSDPESSATETPAPDTQTPEPTVTESATPPPEGEAPEAPSRITDEAILGQYDITEIPGDEPLVAWADAEGTLIHVIGTGSGSEACQPAGESIEVDDGELEIEFEWEGTDPAVACTADLRVFGWAFPVPAGSADITVANVDGWTQDDEDEDSDITVDIRPAG